MHIRGRAEVVVITRKRLECQPRRPASEETGLPMRRDRVDAHCMYLHSCWQCLRNSKRRPRSAMQLARLHTWPSFSGWSPCTFSYWYKSHRFRMHTPSTGGQRHVINPTFRDHRPHNPPTSQTFLGKRCPGFHANCTTFTQLRRTARSLTIVQLQTQRSLLRSPLMCSVRRCQQQSRVIGHPFCPISDL